MLFCLYLVWIMGRLFITNITVSKTTNNSYKIYQNSSIKPIPIYILQLGVYNDINTAQNDAKKFSVKGIVTYIENNNSYRLITDIYTQEKFLNLKKEQLEKKGLSLYVVKSLILNDKHYLNISEKENMHNQLNNLYIKYSQWLGKNELYWVEKEKLTNSPNGKESILSKKEKIINEYTELDNFMKTLYSDIKEEKLKDKIKNLDEITNQYKVNFTNIDNGDESKNYNLAKGQLLACWDHFRYLYEYISEAKNDIN